MTDVASPQSMSVLWTRMSVLFPKAGAVLKSGARMFGFLGTDSEFLVQWELMN